MIFALVGSGLVVGIFVMALPNSKAQPLLVNAVWLLAFAYPGVFAVLNDRAIYDSQGVVAAAGPQIDMASLVVQFFVALCCGLLLFKVKPDLEDKSFRRVLCAILIYLGSQAVVFIAHASMDAFQGWLIVLLVLVVAAAGYEPVEKVERRLRWSFRAYVLGSLMSMAIVPNWALVPEDKSTRAILGLDDRLIGLTDGSNYLGLVASIAFALEVGAMMRRVRFAWIFATASAAACLLSQSRLPLLTIVVVILIFFAFRIGALSFSRRAGSWAMRLAFAGSAAVPILVATSTFLDRRDDLDELATGRVSIWVWTLEEFLEKPILGQGPGFFADFHWDAPGDVREANNAHNQFFEALIHGGVVEGIGFVVMALMLLGLAMRARPNRYGGTVLLLGTVLFSEMIFGTPLRMAGITWNLLQLATFLAIGVATLREDRLSHELAVTSSGSSGTGARRRFELQRGGQLQ